jgi:uncharacterized repeat protein (TIGR01451 family)/uncharacterized repeat protein (TIGR02543 family)
MNTFKLTRLVSSTVRLTPGLALFAMLGMTHVTAVSASAPADSVARTAVAQPRVERPLAAGAPNSKTVLILDTSVVNGASSVEAVQAAALGFTVEMASASQWAAKSQADFATYRALILGDHTCSDLDSIQAAIDNRTTWAPIVAGNIVLIGGDPEYHALSGVAGATTEIKNSIGFAGDVVGKTGLYAAFGCAYYSAPESGTPVPWLDQFGSFEVRGSSLDDVHKVAIHPALAGLTDADLSNWGTSTHAGFTAFPAGFLPLAIQRNVTGNGALSFADGSSGLPYMLARGEGLQAVGLNISKAGPAAAQVGDTIVYTITYGNTGAATANSVVITDPVPAGTTFVSASNGGTLSNGNVIWNLGSLNGGTSGQLLTFRVQLDASGTISNSNYAIGAAGQSAVYGAPVNTTVTGLVLLSVTKAGAGAGSVSSQPSGINCGATCSALYPSGTVVTLTAAPDANNAFTGWSGAGCTGTGSCVVTMDAARSVSAQFTPTAYNVTVTRNGNGAGSVSSTPAGITCGATCTALFNFGTVVTLTATPQTGTDFTGWSGAGCTGAGACVVTVNAAKNVTATFTLQRYTLSVSPSGNGVGTVSSTPAGINCGATCAASFDYGTRVTLTAVASTGSTFTGWSGACTGNNPCVVTIDAAKSVTPSYSLNSYTLWLNSTGTGGGGASILGIGPGSVTIMPADNFEYVGFPASWTVTNIGATTATWMTTNNPDHPSAGIPPGGGSRVAKFSSYGNFGTSRLRTSSPLTLTTGVSCTTRFQMYHDTGWNGQHDKLQVQLSTDGTLFTDIGPAIERNDGSTGWKQHSVTLSSTVAQPNVYLGFEGISDFGNDIYIDLASVECFRYGENVYPSPTTFLYGTVVTLTATPNISSAFMGWSGSFTGSTAPVTLTINSDKVITATFDTKTYTLNATPGGNGSGVVKTEPVGTVFDYGTLVALKAFPSFGSDFTRWEGDLNSTDNPLTTTMYSNKNVTAIFTLKQFTLSVGQPTEEVGAVTSAPAGIHCGLGNTDCAALFNYSQAVTLTATPIPGWSFAGWQGASSSLQSQVTVIIGGDTVITPTYTQDHYILSVNKVGQGSVAVEPEQETYLYDSVVTLTATADPGWTFEGWSGASTDVTTQTQITVRGNTAVTATFTQDQYTLNVNEVGHGDVAVDPNWKTYVYGTLVTLTATADPGWTFAGWSGASSDLTAQTSIVINGNTDITATFTQDQYTLTVNQIGHGNVDVDPDQPTYVYGDVVTLTAMADPGWTFASWQGASTASTAQTTVTVYGNTTITATYTQDQYTLTVNKVGQGSVAVDPNQTHYVYGDSVTLTATAEPGWTFAGWSGASSALTTQTTIVVHGNTAITATFTLDHYTLTVNKTGQGTITVSPNQDNYIYGDVVTLTATADIGWTFDGWSGASSDVTTQTQITMRGNTTIRALFTQDQYVLTVNKVGHGSVAVNPNQATFIYNTLVTLTATADPGWTFAGWSGASSDVTAQTSIVVFGNTAITATFTQDHYTLTIIKTGSGTITVSPNQADYVYGDVVTLTAAPAANWSFAGWSGNAYGLMTTTQVIMNRSLTVFGTFRLPELVQVQAQPGVIAANGISTTQITVHVIDVNGNPVPNVALTLATNAGTLAPTGVTDGAGAFSTMLTSSVISQTATVTVQTANGKQGTVQVRFVNGDIPTAVLVGAYTPSASSARAGDVLTFTLVVTNVGQSLTDQVELSATLPAYTTLNGSVQGGSNSGAGYVTWSGSLMPNETHTLMYRVVVNQGVTLPAFLTSEAQGLVQGLQNFDLTAVVMVQKFTLSVGQPMDGAGVVTSVPAGIDCGMAQTACSGTYDYGTAITLTAAAQPGWTFTGWQGASNSTQAQVRITVNSDTIITPTFTQDLYTLTVNKIGHGSVAAQPDQATYTYGTLVTLTATADPGWTFAGWQGASNGSLPQTTVVVNGNATITATFTQDHYTLTVIKVGNGTVGAQPTQADYLYGEGVTLTAAPDANWSFVGWSGDASGTATSATVTMNANRTVTATFRLPDTVQVQAVPAVIAANGISTTQITVHVTDAGSNPVPHTALTLTTSAGTLTALTGMTDGTGAFSTTLTSSVISQTATVTVQTTSGKQGTAQVRFVNGDIPTSVLVGEYTASAQKAKAGDVLTFTLVVTSVGQSLTDQVELTATLPGHTTLSGSVQGGHATGDGHVQWTGSLMPNERHTLVFQVVVNQGEQLPAYLTSEAQGLVQGVQNFDLTASVKVFPRYYYYLPVIMSNSQSQ